MTPMMNSDVVERDAKEKRNYNARYVGNRARRGRIPQAR